MNLGSMLGRFAALAYENEVGLFHHAQLSSALGGLSVLNKTVPLPFPFRSERLPVTLTASSVISTGRLFPRGLQTAGIPPPCPLPPPHIPLSHGPGAPEPRVLGATAVSTPTVHLMCQQPKDRFAGGSSWLGTARAHSTASIAWPRSSLSIEAAPGRSPWRRGRADDLSASVCGFISCVFLGTEP